MDFYSKTPNQLRKSNEDRSLKTQKRRRVGRLILLFDILLVVIIMLYLFEKKSNSNNKQNTLEKISVSGFEYKGFQIDSKCINIHKCIIWLSFPERGVHNYADAQLWQYFEFILTTTDAKDELFSAKFPLSQLGSKLQKSKKIMISYEFPLEIKEHNRVYVRLIDSKNKERIKFKIFAGGSFKK